MKKLLTTLFASLILLSSCGKVPDDQTAKEYIPEVEIIEITAGGEEVFRVNGEVGAEKSASLTAELRGDVQSIFVKPGDRVVQGQTLVQLYSQSVASSLSTARDSLLHARSSLSQTSSSVEKNIEAAAAALEKAESYLENLLKQNEKTRKQAEETLNSTKISFSLSSSTAQTTLSNAVSTMNTSIQSALTTADEIVGVSALYKNSNDDYENHLGALNSKIKTDAKNAIQNLINAYTSIQETYDSVYSIGKIAETALQKTLNMLNVSTTGINYSQTDLDTHISSVTTELSSLRSSLSTLASAKKSLEQTLNSTNLSGEESQTIISAEAQYEATIATLNTAEEDARKQVEAARIAYESAKESAKLSETNASSSLTSASGSYTQAQINQSKLTITAPFTGEVVDVPVKIGDEITPGELIVEVENTRRFKITAYLTPYQVSKVAVGDAVKIGKKSSDIISAISPNVDPQTRKHKVEILHQNEFLNSGQIIALQFTARSSDFETTGFLIPLIALHVNADSNFVWIIDEDMKTEKRSISVGEIRGSRIEVTSGLNEGDRVIVKGGRMLKKEGEKVSILGDEKVVAEEENQLEEMKK